MAQRYRDRISRSVEYLGGKCVECGTTEELQMDHIDKATKCFTLTDRWHLRWDEYVVELNKCQLLCETHHREKSIREQTTVTEHGGGANGIKGCKCYLCKARRAAYSRAYYAEHGR